MRIHTPERRYGYLNTTFLSSRSFVNFGADGSETSRGATSAVSLPFTRNYRDGKSRNWHKPVPGKPGTKFIDPSGYSRGIAVVSYKEATVKFFDSQNRLRREEKGFSPNGPNNFGPHITGTLTPKISINSQARADTECLLKLKDMKVNFGEALAESRSTVKHLAHTATSLLSFVINLRKGRWQKAHKALGLTGRSIGTGKSAASRWLEYQFAWMPLMSDIHGSYELFQKGLREKAQLFSVTRTITEHEVEWPNDGALRFKSGSSYMSSRTKLYARVSDADIANLTSMGLTDPLQVGWALLPYSFVVDWFLPVGNMLEAIGATKGLTFVGGLRTHRAEAIGTYEYWPTDVNGSPNRAYEVEFSALAMRREKLSNFPFPMPYVKNPFSTSHVTSALALVRQLFK